MGKQFDLSSIFVDVPHSGTGGPEQIVYIERGAISGDDDNFYSIDGVEELAANIELIGLQQPIRVRPDPDDEGGYLIVSGHRRFTAIMILAKDDPERWRTVPCIIDDRPEESDAMRELRLIYANSDTRRMTSADISRQAERVEALLYQLKEEGVKFPGRMRDHVAEACKVSKSKLARLKVIRKGLALDIAKAWWGTKDGLNEAAAYELARLPADLQRRIIDAYRAQSYTPNGVRYLTAKSVEEIGTASKAIAEFRSPVCGPCDNSEAKLGFAIKTLLSSPYTVIRCESKCCGDCDNLESCKFVCSHQLSAQKSLKQKAREEKRDAKEKQAALDAPKIEKIRAMWERFGAMREQAHLSPGDYKKQVDCDCMMPDSEFLKHEGGDVTTGTCLPFSYHFDLLEAQRLVAAADALGCSMDYLFMRTNEPRMAEEVAAAPRGQLMISGWMPGGTNPGHRCECVVDFVVDDGLPLRRLVWWNYLMRRWEFPGGAEIEATPVRWMELPETEDAEHD